MIKFEIFILELCLWEFFCLFLGGYSVMLIFLVVNVLVLVVKFVVVVMVFMDLVIFFCDVVFGVDLLMLGLVCFCILWVIIF